MLSPVFCLGSSFSGLELRLVRGGEIRAERVADGACGAVNCWGWDRRRLCSRGGSESDVCSSEDSLIAVLPASGRFVDFTLRQGTTKEWCEASAFRPVMAL